MGEVTTILRYKNIAFVIKSDKLIVQTRIQAFYLIPAEQHWQRRLKAIQFMIETGAIQDLPTLAHYCKEAVEWVPTRLYKLDLIKQEVSV